MRGRRGIPLDIAINLYKALVRPHWEQGIASWSVLKDSLVSELEKVQASSLKSLCYISKPWLHLTDTCQIKLFRLPISLNTLKLT